MKILLKITALLLVTVLLFSFSFFKNSAIKEKFGTITETEKQALLYMLEEEKLAHDIYVEMYAKWGLMPFSNISKSEKYHNQLIQNLLDSFNIEYKNYETSGEFENQAIQKLYNNLLEKGNISVENAIIVGATIEELDILDLENRLLLTENSSIKSTFDILIMGSKNHLRAFNRNIISHSIDYEPQYLSLEYYNEIIDSKNQSCSNNSKKGCKRK